MEVSSTKNKVEKVQKNPTPHQNLPEKVVKDKITKIERTSGKNGKRYFTKNQSTSR